MDTLGFIEILVRIAWIGGAVAFVLGLLVWELISRDDPGPAAEAPAVTTVVTAAPGDAPGPLDLGR